MLFSRRREKECMKCVAMNKGSILYKHVVDGGDEQSVITSVTLMMIAIFPVFHLLPGRK
jgi:hypothetical protein